MRYAVISDIHANLHALQAVLDDARTQNIEGYICIGDIVGYNAYPVECLRIIRELNCTVVKGNHDHYCSSEDELIGFHPLAADVVHWTRDQLNEDDKQFLRDLPYTARIKTFTIVHSTLDMPEKWGYVFDELEAEANFTYQRTSLCFFGHTHVPLAFEKTMDIRCHLYENIKLSLGRKYFVNVGSVGQPRDGNHDAAYVVYDMKKSTIDLRRVPYDLAGAQQRIRDAGLPERLAARLEQGR